MKSPAMCNTKKQTTKRWNKRPRRRGNIIVLSAIMMVMTAAFVAFAVDLGSLYVARCELQRAADAAALSAAWDLVDNSELAGTPDVLALENAARTSAANFASKNTVLGCTLSVPTSDIQVGYLSDPTDPSSTMSFSSTNAPNAVRVSVRRTTVQNGPISFGFAKVLGIFSEDLEAEATAALLTNIAGFRAPGDGGNLGILPIALDDTTWNSLLAGDGSDNWNYDQITQTVIPGSDGIKEVDLYPQGTGSPGNRGTVDIGSNNNSTEVLSRQINDGVTESDLTHHGGELKFDSNGKLYLNGDTGISAGIKDDLASIIGQPRTIPIFTQVQGPGNNATYTITKFVGVRVLEVKLTGSQSSKRVIIQPAAMIARGAIPATDGTHSDFMYSPVWLVN
jgi:Flp pilus assembly protein TadG